MVEDIKPYQVTNIYREARHSRVNSWLYTVLGVGSAIAGFGLCLSNLPLRYQASLGCWGCSLLLVAQAKAATRQADQYQRRRDVLEQASEDAHLTALVKAVQPTLPALLLGNATVERPLVLPSGTSPLEAFAGAVQQLLAQDLELRTDYVDAIAGPQLFQLQLRPHDLKKVKALQGEAMAQAIQVQLSLATPPVVTIERGAIALAIPRPDRQFCPFTDFIGAATPGPLQMAIGVNIRGELVEEVLSGESLQHYVVGGAPRQGKSQTLLSMIGSLTNRYSPQQVQFLCGDGKGGVTFGFLNGSPYLLQPVAFTKDETANQVDYLRRLVEDRYSRFRQVGAQTIDAYMSTTQEPMPFVGVFWDEFQDLFAPLDSKHPDLPVLESLASLAPAAGVFFVWSSQRIDGRLLPPQINSKCLSRLCLKVQKDKDSEFVLNGDPSGVDLLGKGDLLYDDGRQVQRLQGLYIPHRDTVFRSALPGIAPTATGASAVFDQVPPGASTNPALTHQHFPAPNQDGGYGQSAPTAPDSMADPFSAEITPEVRGAVIGARRAAQTQDAIILRVWGCTKGTNARYLAAREKYRRIVSDAGLI